jgi:hypothetical protein
LLLFLTRSPVLTDTSFVNWSDPRTAFVAAFNSH